jgi:hypothetical protein
MTSNCYQQKEDKFLSQIHTHKMVLIYIVHIIIIKEIMQIYNVCYISGSILKTLSSPAFRTSTSRCLYWLQGIKGTTFSLSP